MGTLPGDLERRSLLELTPGAVAEALTASFEGYLMPARFTPAGLERRMRSEALDPEASWVYGPPGAPTGAVLVTRRGWTSRIAAMGVVPSARGTGLARRMLAAVLGEARDRGDRGVVLEVFEQNPRALALYRRMGFAARRRLLGYRRDPEPGEPDALEEIDPLEFSRVAAREGEPGLPWMLTPETFASAVRPARAYALEDQAFALASDGPGEAFTLRALVVRQDSRGRGLGRRLVRALVAHHSGRACAVVQLVPETLAPGFFERAGFAPMPLWQLEMWHDLSEVPEG